MAGKSTSERPSLPSIHSLQLPLLHRNQAPVKENNSYDRKVNSSLFISSMASSSSFIIQAFSPLHVPNSRHGRQVSNSSTNTTSSRTPSPSPSDISMSSVLSGTSCRLMPCSMECADAVVVVTPNERPVMAPQGSFIKNTKSGQAILLVGSAVQQLRQPSSLQAVKGARLHPYRIVSGTTGSRRSSLASTFSV